MFGGFAETAGQQNLARQCIEQLKLPLLQIFFHQQVASGNGDCFLADMALPRSDRAAVDHRQHQSLRLARLNQKQMLLVSKAESVGG